MASTDDSPRPDDRGDGPGMGDETSRRRARWLIPAGILAAIVLVFGFMLLVSQCGTDQESDVLGWGSAAVAVGSPAG